jgi:hypothetical protein
MGDGQCWRLDWSVPPTHHKTQHHDLRRITWAIIWRCQNGAK